MHLLKSLTILIVIIIALYPLTAFCYDDIITHPELTRQAIAESNLNKYLNNYLLMKNGIGEKFSSSDATHSVLEWLQKGSTDEDEGCRKANHFHNPLLSWNESEMRDPLNAGELLWIIDKWCFRWKPLYSNISWATGYSSQDNKFTLTRDKDYSPYNWDKAREHFHNALTATDEVERETEFALTFKVLGHVLHLLEDVAVPAHVRNDFKSHISFWDVRFSSPTRWPYQPYEKYVKTKSELVTQSARNPVFPDVDNLTAFWDGDIYMNLVSGPSVSNVLGLAESTNSSYFSDLTIPNNNPTPEHTFPYPAINTQEYDICEDNHPVYSQIKVKYVSRKEKEGCDHFALVSALNPTYYSNDYTYLNNNISTIRLWLDATVHETYALELLPRAIGYSAELLNYFFRGEIEVVTGIADNPEYRPYVILKNGEISDIKLIIKNSTPGEAMEGGELVVTYEHKRADATVRYGTSNPVTIGIINSNATSEELTFTFDASSRILFEPNQTTFRVVYRGKLGKEEGAVAVSKPFTPIKYSVPAYVNYTSGNLVVNIGGQTYSAAVSGYLNGSFIKVRFAEGNPDIIGVLVREGGDIPHFVVHKFEVMGDDIIYQGEGKRLPSKVERPPTFDAGYINYVDFNSERVDDTPREDSLEMHSWAKGTATAVLDENSKEVIRKTATDLYISNDGGIVKIIGKYEKDAYWTRKTTSYEYGYIQYYTSIQNGVTTVHDYTTKYVLEGDKMMVYVYYEDVLRDGYPHEFTSCMLPITRPDWEPKVEVGVFSNDQLETVVKYDEVLKTGDDLYFWYIHISGANGDFVEYYARNICELIRYEGLPDYHPKSISWAEITVGPVTLSADKYVYSDNYNWKTVLAGNVLTKYYWGANSLIREDNNYSVALLGITIDIYHFEYKTSPNSNPNVPACQSLLVNANNEVILFTPFSLTFGDPAVRAFPEYKGCYLGNYMSNGQVITLMEMAVPFLGSAYSDVTFKRLP